METLWFGLVTLLITVYVVLDGFDLGTGALHLWVARGDRERRTVLQSIGPVWDGNEVWLLAGGGSMFLAFPKLYASGFSGFYLPLMMVLWLLIARATSIELRSHVDHLLWKQFWDVAFCASSLLLPLLFGAALGNIVRGVSLGEDGYFFAPLWTTAGHHDGSLGVLDSYTVTVAFTALLALTVHGGLWLNLKTEARLQERSQQAVRWFYLPLVVCIAFLTIASFRIQPHLPSRFSENPAGLVLPFVALAGLISMRWFLAKGREGAAFLASCAFLSAMLASVAFGLYPYVLPSQPLSAHSLTVTNAAADAYGLEAALWWWIPGILLAIVYTVLVYRSMRGKTRMDPEAY